MTGWLQLTDEQRRITLTQAQQRTGIIVKAIEKDWWVTLTLKALFQSAYAEFLVFKGGTSLSKGWKLISRFSEDIDIALDPEALGMTYEENPSKKYVEKLRREGCVFTSTLLKDELAKQLNSLGVPEGAVSIEAEPVPEKFPDTDPQILYVKYKSLYDPNLYIADQVKIEMSVRSKRTPFTVRPVLSILSEVFPNPAYAETAFPVTITEPRKTFLEKAFLLHEEFGKADTTKIRSERMSRHFYDLVSMYTTIGPEALRDHTLYDQLILHRKGYIRASWVDYAALAHSTITFIPSPQVLELYREDYQVMAEHMIHEEQPPAFDYLIEQLKLLQGSFRMKMQLTTLEQIITEALSYLPETFNKDPEGTIYTIPVTLQPDLYQLSGTANKTITYEVGFIKKNGKAVFESIKL